MADCLFGILRHQCFQLSLGPLVVQKRLPSAAEYPREFRPGIRRAENLFKHSLLEACSIPALLAFNEAWGFIRFTYYLRTEPETCFEKNANKCLRADKINYLKQKFPRSNYQSTLEWVEAITKEIFSVLIPAEEQMMEALRQWKADCQVAGTILQAVELLDYEFKQSELPEARIARKAKSLFELKTMEQMLGRT
jgi:hypothetical protein